MATIEAAPLPFDEAIDFFKQKVRLPTRHWTDLWEGQHARAFVVAGATKDALLADFQKSILKAMENGTTLADFRKDFDRIVAKHGWSCNGSRGWRSRVIYQTNLRMAHASGRWRQIQRVKKRRPFLRYISVQDDRTRAEHRRWHGTVLRADDAWWKTHYPPNGWNCRCTARPYSGRDLDRFGHKVSDDPPSGGTVSHTINTPSGPLTVKVPDGIDPGFGYNVGESAWGTRISEDAMNAWQAEGAKAWERLTPGDWQTAGRPALVPLDPPQAKLGPPAADEAAMRKAVEKAIGGAEKVFTMPDGSPLLVNAEALAGHVAANRAPFVPFLPELVKDPYEIWLAFERHRGTGRVELRKRLVKVIDMKKGGLILVAQAVEGRLEAWTFIPTERLAQLKRWRIGSLLYGR